MNNVSIHVLAEGITEKKFIESILTPYLANKNIFMTVSVIDKPGEKGGDVKFTRTIREIGNFLKQRNERYVTTFIDYYGIKEWPGTDKVSANMRPLEKADHINTSTLYEVNEQLALFRSNERFIPFIAIHEFEALLFSEPQILASKLNVDKSVIDAIITECREPENINNSPQTAPSKRLNFLTDERFRKTTTGIIIAKEIGVERIRDKCPVFNQWLAKIENLQPIVTG